MKAIRKMLTLLLAAMSALPTGCISQKGRSFVNTANIGEYEKVASEIEYPTESACTAMNTDPSVAAPPPWTIGTQGTPDFQDISLEECIQLTLANSRVMRELGGAVVRAPAQTRTTYDPAVAETDPQFGIERALSEFDAQFLTSSYWERNDRALNNEFFGGGTRLLQQDLGVFQTAITKRSVTGTRFTIRHNVDYDANNAPGNFFPSAWNTNVEMEARHPFLKGSGTQFNRIAGPDNEPGYYNGVLIARLNTDIALNDFEIAVRDLVSNVENAYWDLYFGYRVLDARVRARDVSLETWRKIQALYEVERRGGEAEREAQAREQYFRFQQDVQNALSGEPYDSSRNWNGQPSGAFRATGGVLLAERRLRLLMGLPPSDAKLLRPIDEPVMAKIEFDWAQVTEEATTRRAELRRQKWQVRKRELEMLASKNYLLPQLDGVARYRWRGFGDDLFPVQEPPLPRFDSAYSDLMSGDFQEWQLGFELSMPIGFRQAHVAARNAELLLSRERALLQEQQREVVHEAADAISEMDRAYVVLQTSYNRLVAARDQLGAIQAAYDNDRATIDLLLEAQRRLTEAEVEYYLNRSRYSLAAKNVHFVKGTLLEYDGIFLAEGPWPGKAYADAAQREKARDGVKPLNYASSKAPVVSRGPFAQQTYPPIQNSNLNPFVDDQMMPILKEKAPTGAPAMPTPPRMPGEESLPAPGRDPLSSPTSGATAPVQAWQEAFAAAESKSGVVKTSGFSASSVGDVLPAINFQSSEASGAGNAATKSPSPQRLPATRP